MSNRALQTWIPRPADDGFGLEHLPYGALRRADRPESRLCIRVGDVAIDLAELAGAGLFSGIPLEAVHTLQQPTLNAFLALGGGAWRPVRQRLQHLLASDERELRDNATLRSAAILPLERVELVMPVAIGDYTDFYSSKHHAVNIGTMIRGADNALQPNWVWLPVGYHGRASSVVISGTPIRRPIGQTMADGASEPTVGPSRLLDFELEIGFVVGPGTTLGERVPIAKAEDHIFGVTLVNDWSARDIQKWEYVPLGPFLSKNFATSISPWITPLEALEPLRCAPQPQTPTPPTYLRLPADTSRAGQFDLALEVLLTPAGSSKPEVISRTNTKHLYWTMAQQLAHHTVNGCPIRPGDLMASGTISGPTPDSLGCLMELTWRGERPLTLADGVQRKFLQDGDTLTLRGAGRSLTLGECSGTVLPASEG